MDNLKNDTYYVGKILENIDFVSHHMENVTEDYLSKDEILLDGMLF